MRNILDPFLVVGRRDYEGIVVSSVGNPETGSKLVTGNHFEIAVQEQGLHLHCLRQECRRVSTKIGKAVLVISNCIGTETDSRLQLDRTDEGRFSVQVAREVPARARLRHGRQGAACR